MIFWPRVLFLPPLFSGSRSPPTSDHILTLCMASLYATDACGNIFMPNDATYGMANYAIEINRCRKVGDLAEKMGHTELAEMARRLAESYEERSNDSRD